MKKNLYITIFSLFIPTFFVHAYTFTNALTIGSTGQDVYELQKILNTNSQTTITTEGPGSPGNESYYFGEKTKQAVIKFQNIYANEILYPNGLTQGTGFVGKSTLNLLNSLQEKNQTSTDVLKYTSITDNTIQKQTSSTPEFLISKTKVKADRMIYVGSQHILTETNFYLDGKEMWKRCQTEYTCKLHIDKDTKSGTYKIKSNNDSWGFHKIDILSSTEKEPETSVKKLYLNESNTIKGKNFSEKMKVYTMFGVFETETKNDSFILEFPKEYVKNATTTTPGFFYLENSNGLTSNPKRINYEI